ncbi:AccI family restriction endonuclease [Gelidibacter sp. F2691]|nr:AccI family restriction endonuclease [Gelidibacter sp. F2691]
MTYFDELREITKIIPDTIVDFSIPRDRTSAPTQTREEQQNERAND